MKSKTVLFFLGMAVVITVIIGLVFIFVPKETPVNAKFYAVKLNDGGNEIGSTNIILDGYTQRYITKVECLDIEITPFDGFSNIEPVIELENNKYGVITYNNSLPYGYAIYSAEQGNAHRSLIVCFSSDFGRWLICSEPSMGSGDTVYYLGSTSASDSVDDLKEFFAAALPK